MNIKQELYNQCFHFIENRLLIVRKTIAEIQKALLSETKSSAGDKHEIGRAMLQLEREKTGNQLAEIIKIKASLSKINTSISIEKARLGSVVYTSKANYFLSISAGELEIDNIKYYAISPNTPIGKLLIGKRIGDTIIFRTNTFKVIAVQ